MGGGQVKAPARMEAQPGLDGRLAIAAGIVNIAQTRNIRQALRLNMEYRLTEAQALTLTSMIWGARA